MAMWFRLRINAEHIGMVEVRRQEHLDLTNQAAIQDAVSTYSVFRDGQPIGSVKHRYGDGAWKLLALTADLIVEEDAC